MFEVAVDDRRPAADEERPATPEHHRRREHEQDPIQPAVRQQRLQRLARKEFRDHEREHRRGDSRRPPEPTRHVIEFGIGLFKRDGPGSSAMPQMGHAPGTSRTISGCIGHVHSTLVIGATSTGSSAIPHFGHAPGPFWRTSGSIGTCVLALHVRRCRRCCAALRRETLQASRGIGPATLAAEVVRAALVVDVPHRVVGRDGHPTDGVEHLGRRDGCVIVRIRRHCLGLQWFNAALPSTLHSGQRLRRHGRKAAQRSAI